MPGRRIPHDLRLALYKRVLELHNKGVSYRKIQRILKDEYGVDVSRSNISYWIRGLHVPEREPYNHPDMSKDKELAWIAGAYAGDGSIKVNRKGHFFSLKVKDRELAEEAVKKLAIIMGRDRPYAVGRLADGRYYVEVQSRELVDHLSKRENIFMHLRRNPGEFIQAFFDCEASSTGTVSATGYFQGFIVVSNTDLDLLKAIRRELVNLGISPSEISLAYRRGRVFVSSKGRVEARRDCYRFTIRGLENLRRFREEIGFIVERKRRKLDDIINVLQILQITRDMHSAAIEWIRRYEYKKGLGRERWFPRERILGLKEAREYYKKFLGTKGV